MGRGFTAYSIHKKLYPGTYSFKDEAVGATDTDIDFINDGEAGTGTLTVLSDYDAHRKVVHLTSGGAASSYKKHSFTGQTLGTIEFWIVSITADGGRLYVLESGSLMMYVDINTTTLGIDYGDGIGGHSTNNTAISGWVHVRLTFDCATDTFSAWVDGVSKLTDVPFYNDRTPTTLDQLWLSNEIADTDASYDAIGFSWDTDYKVGDNYFWRSYKMLDDDFEINNIPADADYISWVDAFDTAGSVRLVGEFNEHKKVLRQAYTSAVGGNDNSTHNFDTQAKNGWIEYWIKTNDATARQQILLQEDGTTIIGLRYNSDTFEYIDSTGTWQTIVGITPLNNIWYHFYIKWVDAANDTFDIWINNIQYLNSIQCRTNQTSGVNKIVLYQYDASDYLYIDAVCCSLDSEDSKIGDNRTLDYHTYTKTDITDYVSSAIKTSEFYKPFELTFKANKDFYFDEVFFQFYDVNDKLAFEGEMKNRIQTGKIRTYPCRDIAWDEYNEPITQTFSSAKIHDPSDSTSMLKVALSTVGQVDGDLILVNADTKTDTYSPTLKNYPTELFLRDLADIADSNIIRYANGIIGLDDDLASGITLDVDTTAHKDKMITPPLLNNIIESFNYFEIFGAINVDTGERYYKVIDNSGTDKKHKYRYVNNNFRNQTDVDAYATKIAARSVTALQITQSIQDLGALELGTTINYKYVDANADINIPQANYVIIREKLFLHQNKSRLTFSEGVIESSKYANYYEKALEHANAFAAEIYDTDINTVYLEMYIDNGATLEGYGVRLDAVGEEMKCNFLVDDKVDPSRKLYITISWLRVDAVDDTINAILDIDRWPKGAGVQNVEHLKAITLNACADNEMEYYTYEMAISDVNAGNSYTVALQMNEVDRSIIVRVVAVRYFVRRVIS